ncbi:uncharacterized protein B0T15DRAFT_495343 [Chaetomium strumarium]|uniref:C2H2-type domain-containing protein n=1 Tax=Chaetomium strumarium TaxID=1170767 RepID=A0AAJ0GRR7_9PEZI|nr:hypothetical protein B0T15DRAFT_495343 [Chaetomium strumarium]
MAKFIAGIPDIAHDQEELRSFRFPPPTVAPIPFIAPPEADGVRCDRCGFVVRTVAGMRRHCRKEHGWVSSWAKGGDVAKRAKEERPVPWTTGVRCQRLFRSRAASGWFENRRRVEPGDEKTEPNAWLDTVGWAAHLAGLDRDRLRGSVAPIGEDEAVLRHMWESMERVARRAQAAVLKRRGHAVLFVINKKDVHVKPTRPFDGRMEDDTTGTTATGHRTSVTRKQGDLFDAFVEMVEERVQAEAHTEPSEAERQAREDRIDRLCLDATVAFFDHPYKDTPYESALISRLAVLGIREDDGWAGPGDFTPKYSAVIKIARMLVVYQSVVEREDEAAALRA